MKFLTLVTILSCQLALGSAISIPPFKTKIEKRRSETDATFYAYGTNTTGWPISYSPANGKDFTILFYLSINKADHESYAGLLYIAAEFNDTTNNLASITWDV